MNQFYNPFEFNFETTVFSDNNYSIIGKALFIATKFESETKSLSTLVGIKVNPSILTDDTKFKKFLSEINKLFLSRHIKNIGLRAPLDKVLTKARNSRNFIAHELTLGIENIIETDGARQQIINNCREHIGNILEGEKIILSIICKLSNYLSPVKEYFDNYSRKIIDWVISTED